MCDPLAIDESPRALRYHGDLAPPLALLLQQMRQNVSVMNALLADVACDQFELAQALQEASADREGNTANAWKAVEIIVERLQEILDDHRVQIEDVAGASWADAMRQEYDLIGFEKRDDVESPRVAHVHMPLVRRCGNVIRKGQVTVDAPASRKATEAKQEDKQKGS